MVFSIDNPLDLLSTSINADKFNETFFTAICKVIVIDDVRKS